MCNSMRLKGEGFQMSSAFSKCVLNNFEKWTNCLKWTSFEQIKHCIKMTMSPFSESLEF